MKPIKNTFLIIMLTALVFSCKDFEELEKIVGKKKAELLVNHFKL